MRRRIYTHSLAGSMRWDVNCTLTLGVFPYIAVPRMLLGEFNNDQSNAEII